MKICEGILLASHQVPSHDHKGFVIESYLLDENPITNFSNGSVQRLATHIPVIFDNVVTKKVLV